MNTIFNFFRRCFSKKYNRIISLGQNCEVAFQFLRHYDFVEANLFTWSFVYKTKDLLNALSHLNTFAVDFAPANEYMWKCKNFDVSFHGRAEMIPDDEEMRNAEKDELISRAAHLKNKFIDLSNEKGKILFAYKVPLDDLEHIQDTVDSLDQIVETLSSLGMQRFDVLVIVTTEYYAKYKSAAKKMSNCDCLYIEAIDFHTHFSSITTGPWDKCGWKKIWTKYRPSKHLKRGSYKFDS